MPPAPPPTRTFQIPHHTLCMLHHVLIDSVRKRHSGTMCGKVHGAKIDPSKLTSMLPTPSLLLLAVAAHAPCSGTAERRRAARGDGRRAVHAPERTPDAAEDLLDVRRLRTAPSHPVVTLKEETPSPPPALHLSCLFRCVHGVRERRICRDGHSP